LGNLSLTPGFVFEGDFYVIAGDCVTARQTIYRLHGELTIPVIFAPFEATDQPAPGAVISGVTTVSGWAFADMANVTKVEVLVDDVTDGVANYGDARPDVVLAYPDSPLNVGFSYSLNTTRYPNGTHRIYLRVTDSSGNAAMAPSVPVAVSNL
jgi:Bacterial Ig domain